MDQKEVQSFLVIFSIIALFLALTVILLFALFQKRKNRLIQEQQKAESRFKEEIIETQIEIKEDTLRNVSWELHDNIGQLLTLAKIQLQNAKGNPEVIEDAIATIGTSLNELRNLSKLINPSALSNLTLVEALKQEVERFNRLKYLNASMDSTDATFTIDNKKEIIIFRMLQEFFTNTVKHSKASKLMVNVAFNERILYINAQDDGVGFDTTEVSSKKGIGLSNILNRAKLIGADVKITSKPGEGTHLSLSYKVD